MSAAHPEPAPARATASTGTPTVALALGGGSARGLAHIAILEAFDELGIKPKVIAGTSIGAIIGACYAAGLTAREIRVHAGELLSSRSAVLYRLASHLPGHLTTLWSPWRPAVVDGVALLDMLLPERTRIDFSALAIPFRVIATDFYGLEQVVLTEGPLVPAVAASASLPSIMRPVETDGRLLIDGGFVNPTPYDVVIDEADITVAIDVTGAPNKDTPPASLSTDDLWNGAFHALFTTVTREKLARRKPDIFVRPQVTTYESMDFLKMDEILAAAEPAKQEVKRSLAKRLDRA